jgi:hypothetical protein
MTRGVDEATATATTGEAGGQPVHRISVNVSFFLPFSISISATKKKKKFIMNQSESQR